MRHAGQARLAGQLAHLHPDPSQTLGGAQGKRYSLANSRIMIHQPLGGAQGQAAGATAAASWMLWQLRVASVLALKPHLADCCCCLIVHIGEFLRRAANIACARYQPRPAAHGCHAEPCIRAFTLSALGSWCSPAGQPLRQLLGLVQAAVMRVWRWRAQLAERGMSGLLGMSRHHGSAMLTGRRFLADIEIQANEILHHKLTLNGYLAEFTGQSMEQITQARTGKLAWRSPPWGCTA